MNNTVLLVEIIIHHIQLCLQILNNAVRLVKFHCFDQLTGEITKLNKRLKTLVLRCSLIETELAGGVIFLEENLIVRHKKAVITQIRRNLNLNAVSGLSIHISATLMTDLRRELSDSFMKCRFQVKAVLGDNHCTAAVELVALDHSAKHHIGVLFKILVYWQTVSNFTDVYPIGNIGHFSNRLAFTLLQEDDVSCDRCSCVILKCTVLAAWQTDSTDKVGFIRKHLSCRFITLIKCSCRGNKCHDSAVFQLVESFCKEEIVQFRCIVDSICEALISTPTLKSGNRPYSMNIK